MSTVEVYGASDDLIEVEGNAPGCDEYNAEDAHFVLVGEAGKVRLWIRYTERGVWAIEVAPVEEDARTLPVTIDAEGYSAHAHIEGVQMIIRESV